MSKSINKVKMTVEPENAKWVFEYSVAIDKDTLEPVVEVSKRDLDKEIQSYKDECGFAYVMRQIAAGRLSIRDVMPTEDQFGDSVGAPESINDAHQGTLEAVEAGKAEAAKLGLKAFTEQELQNYINEELKKAQAAKSSDGNNQETVK